MIETISKGFMIFVSDGDEGIGSVREVRRAPPELVIYIENTDDFLVPLSAVKEVHAGKVILDHTQLDVGLRDAIGHARDAEDPSYASSGPNEDNQTQPLSPGSRR